MGRRDGLYYYGAKYYDPRISSWMSTDPAGVGLVNPMEQDNEGKLKPKQDYSIVEALNWYSYVSNNPVKYVDPTGRQLSPYQEAMHKGLGHLIVGGLQHLAGSEWNFFHNVFRGNATYGAGPTVSLFGMSAQADIEYSDGGLKLTGDVALISGLAKSTQEKVGSKVKISANGMDISVGLVSVGIEKHDDGTATLNIDFGLNLKKYLGKLGDNIAGASIGVSITASTEQGPGGTFKNGQNPNLNSNMQKAERLLDPTWMVDRVK